jgi:uncharacterized protein (TIGR02996 family)
MATGTIEMMMATLATAQQAIDVGDSAQALEHLLTAWRKQPAPALAAAIHAVGERAAAGRSPPTGKTARDKNRAWDELADRGRPADLDILLASLTDTKGSGETLERIERLLKHPRDPRLALKLAELIEVPRYNASVSRTLPFWKRLFAVLPELGDPRLVARAEKWPTLWRENRELNPPEIESLGQRLAKLLPELRRGADAIPPLDEEARAAVTALVATLAQKVNLAAVSAAQTEESLLAGVWRDPDADAPRLVYADWLQERDDPRGELMTLQFARAAGTLTRAQAAREKALLAEFTLRWLGPLATELTKKGLQWERGFVSAGQAKRGVLDDKAAWATLRAVHGGVPASDATNVPLLRVVTGVTNLHVRTLATLRRPFGITTLEWDGPLIFSRGDFNDDGKQAIADFTRITALTLETLHLRGTMSWRGWMQWPAITPQQLSWAWTAPACARLRELQLPTAPAHLGTLMRLLGPTSLTSFTLRTLGAASWERALRLTLTRDGDGNLARLHIGGPGKLGQETEGDWTQILAALAALPATSLSAVELEETEPLQALVAKHRAELDAALARQTRLPRR